MHAPGLKVVAPADPADAKGLLTAAIRDPNPVIFMEHKALYRSLRAEVPEGEVVTPFEASIIQRGTELTLITYGAMVSRSLEAVQEFGDRVEVLDLRTLFPLDQEAILASVRRTSKVLIVDEANETAAAGAQVAAIIAEHAFEDLDGPVRRLAAADVPIPFSPSLEEAVIPDQNRIRDAVSDLLAY